MFEKRVHLGKKFTVDVSNIQRLGHNSYKPYCSLSNPNSLKYEKGRDIIINNVLSVGKRKLEYGLTGNNLILKS